MVTERRRPRHARADWRTEDCGWCGAWAGVGCDPDCPWPDPPVSARALTACSSCGCRATTSRDGAPVCWHCADERLDGVACWTCGAAGARPAIGVNEFTGEEFEIEREPRPSVARGTLFDRLVD